LKQLLIIKNFYQDVQKEKRLVFNYERLTDFERALFLTTKSIIKKTYDYNIGGLTEKHKKRFQNYLTLNFDTKSVQADIIIEHSFSIYSNIIERSVSLDYGGESKIKSVKNFDLFINDINEYLIKYELFIKSNE
jgi:ABC-type branched-subunit amino acid transport system ATPase component